MNPMFSLAVHRFCFLTVTVAAMRLGLKLTRAGLVLTGVGHVCMCVWLRVCILHV